MCAAVVDRWRRASRELVGGDAVVPGRVADVVPEAVEQPVEVASRIAGGLRGVLVGPGRSVTGRKVLGGGRSTRAGGWTCRHQLVRRNPRSLPDLLSKSFPSLRPPWPGFLGALAFSPSSAQSPRRSGPAPVPWTRWACAAPPPVPAPRPAPGPLLSRPGAGPAGPRPRRGGSRPSRGRSLLLPLLALAAPHLLLGGAPRPPCRRYPPVPAAGSRPLVVRSRAGAPMGHAGAAPHLPGAGSPAATCIGPDLGGELGHRLPDLQLQVGQFTTAVGQLGAAGVRDGGSPCGRLRWCG